MKRIFYALAMLVIALSSCESDNDAIDSGENLPAYIEKDLYSRYPDASISNFSSYADDNTTRISFDENDGIESTAIYLNGTWLITQKEYNPENFIFDIPRKVIRTYLRTGVSEEEFLTDAHYVVEISRNGFDQKQYEFHFTTPFITKLGVESHLMHNIIISEDGTLLAFDHSGLYNRSIWWYDIRDSRQCVTERYPSSSIIGVVNEGGSNIFYIKDNGSIKKVTTRMKFSGFEWVETQHQLDLNNSIPEYVESSKKKYEAQNPDKPFFQAFFVENANGNYYRLCFGSEMNADYIDVEAE